MVMNIVSIADRAGVYVRAFLRGLIGGEFHDLAEKLGHGFVCLGLGHRQTTYRSIDDLDTAQDLLVRADHDKRRRRQTSFNRYR